MPSWKACANFVRKIAENYRLPYYTISPTYSVCKTHGYISGEVYTCPECGEKTEVYSRITGYYRPVQNWNDGKSEEFKNRKTYDAENSVLKSEGQKQEACACEKEETKQVVASKTLLFTSPTCPNCKLVKQILAKSNFQYEEVDAVSNKELCKQYNIAKAPTLLVLNGDQYEIYDNASLIKGYIEKLK